jgi:butyrate kinase
MANRMRGNGGFMAYFGIYDIRKIETMIDSGDKLAGDLFWYMAYQIAKGIGELSVAQCGKLDRIILTGGLAYSKRLTSWISERVSFLAPVVIIPGEREMLALALGGLRVLNGEEPLKEYSWLPSGYKTLEEFLSGVSRFTNDVQKENAGNAIHKI